jgi:anti-sigma factor RsiW
VSAGLTCRELVELVTDYLDGALPPSEREAFEAHILSCPGCEEYLAQIRQTIALTGRLTEDTLLPTVRDRLLASFRTWKQD